jgi:ABC-type enterochelin transport system substrate-binding protein
MKKQCALAVLLASTLALTACAKNDSTPAEKETSSVATSESTAVTAEQQAAIDAIDKPVLDEKNTDVPASVANAPADAATPHVEDK